jgi:hypothetical protein
VRAAVEAWERFWFAGQRTSTLTLMRIAFGLVALGWAIALGHDLFNFFGESGVVQQQPETESWGLLRYLHGDTALICIYAALLVAAVCTTLGLGTRVAMLVLFVAIISFERRNPYVFNSGDAVLRNTAFFLMLAPCGAALSLDRVIRRRADVPEFPVRSMWPVRLIQVQLSAIYLFAVWAKVRGVTWNDGTAVSYALRLDDLARFPLPGFVATSPLIASLATYGTLATELAIAVLVWNGRARRYVLAAGVLLHCFIDYSIYVGFFSYAMFVMYLAFLPPETAERAVAFVRGLISRVRGPSPSPGRAT